MRTFLDGSACCVYGKQEFTSPMERSNNVPVHTVRVRLLPEKLTSSEWRLVRYMNSGTH